MAATVEESTPPDMATAMVLEFSIQQSAKRTGADARISFLESNIEPNQASHSCTRLKQLLIFSRERISLFAVYINCTDNRTGVLVENRNDDL